ncbi:esterase/lipase family protein [Archangium sp.]|uniref:esterase/lipase family protein n=1 Tax=Archangium sp. TaxID=1872627 RepID=UPI003899A9AD
MNRHLVLVPGFGGFDALGTLRYYEGVTGVLERMPLVLHYFPNLPTASVRTRAEQLLSFLNERWRRKEIRPGDEIHLVGHSTGGLDLRQLLLRYRELERAPGPRKEESALEVLGRIRSVQFLSTPQRGTNLVCRLNHPLARTLLLRPLLRACYESVRGLRERGTSESARLLRLLLLRGRRVESDNWIDALLDTAQGCYSREGAYPSALARASYFELLRWLLHMASDSSALSDLSPTRLGDAPPSPAHEDDPEGERRFLDEHGIRYASIVTVAQPRSGRWLDLFNRLHAFTAESPVPRLGQPQGVRKLLEPGSVRMLSLADNDGLVNTLSQVWPDAASCSLVDADHADVIGHFQADTGGDTHGAFKRYDLLNSASDFDAPAFTALWTRIAGFAQGRAYHEASAPPHASRGATGSESHP